MPSLPNAQQNPTQTRLVLHGRHMQKHPASLQFLATKTRLRSETCTIIFRTGNAWFSVSPDSPDEIRNRLSGDGSIHHRR
jgi:hypothetical protein